MRIASTALVLVASCTIDAVVADDAGFATASSVGDGTTTTGTVDASSAADSSTTGGSEDEGPKLDIAETSGGALGCSGEAPDTIYVMLGTSPQQIWSYDPIENAFAPYATITCPEIEGDITGFSLDRRGTIFLMSREPEDPDLLPNPAMQITRFDPVGGGCEVAFYGGIPYTTPQSPTPSAVDCADVAFVSMPDDPDRERLFAHKCTSGSFTMVDHAGVLLRMDPSDDEPTFDQLATDAYTSVALAGTGDGRLYGVGGNAKVSGGQIIEYAQEDGAVLSVAMEPDLDLGDLGVYIALAFYAGDLYTFGADDSDGFMLTIHRYDLDDDDATGIHEITPVALPDDLPPGGIVAATSPTCIPLTPEG